MLPLRDYQIDDLSFYFKHPRCLNLSDPGTGKTPSVCVYAYYNWNRNKFRSVWTMPKSLLQKNKDELLRFTNFRDQDICIVDGNPTKRKELMGSDAKVFLFGFEAFRRNWETLLKTHPDIKVMLVDEVHMGYSSNSSKRTQELYRAMKKITFFIGMTGTLINGRLDSAFPSVNIIESRYYGNYKGFINYHASFIDSYGKVLVWTKHGKLKTILNRHGIRHSFEEIFGKESKIINVEMVGMLAVQKKAYKKFEDEAFLELEKSFLQGFLPGVAAIRARQIMAHPETFGIGSQEYTGKDQRLLVHLADAANSGTAMIIYSALIPEQTRTFNLIKNAGLSVGLINSTVNSRTRSRIDKNFRSGHIQILVASPATAAVGFNWNHVDHIVFVSMDYMDTSFLQAYRRAMRNKRTKPLLITVLQYSDSIDQRIYEIVKEKSKLANIIDPTRPVFNL